MGKHLHLKHSNVQFEDYHPSCMWGISHLFDYHHWPNVKKLLPHRKHGGGRHDRSNYSANSSLTEHEAEEMLQFLGAECDCIVEQTPKTISTNKRSGIARIKALITKEMSKVEHHKRKSLQFPVGSRLQRTYSIHHLEPPDDYLAEIKTDWKHPIFLLHNITDSSVTKAHELPLLSAPENLVSCNDNCDLCGTMNFADHSGKNQHKCIISEQCEKASETSDNPKIMDANQIEKDVSDHQFKEYIDALELFKVNKELFVEILRDPNAGRLNHVNSLQDFKTKSRLTKLASFPMANLSRSRKLRPRELEHKQNEIWSCPKGKDLFNGTRAPSLVASKSSKDPYSKSMSSMADTSLGGVLKLEKSFSSPCSTHGSNDQQRGQVVENIKRASSLNNSLDRYAQLFEHSSHKDTKFHLSKSLKLANEDEFLSGRHVPKYCRRALSLSNIESHIAPQNDGYYDSPISEMQIKPCSINIESAGAEPELIGLPMNIEKWLPVNNAVVETQCQENMIEESDSCPRADYTSELTNGINDGGTDVLHELSENMIELIMGESNSHLEVDTGSTENDSSQNQIARKDLDFKGIVACNAESKISGGSELKSRCMHSDDLNELNTFVNVQNRSSTDALAASFRVNSENNDSQKIENATEAFDNYDLHIELDGKHDADFTNVRDILDKSGIVGNDYLRTWHSLDQPLSTSPFEELEASLVNEAGLYGEEACDSWDHHLLLDLVDEVLLEIHDKSYTYWPRALSHTCRVHPMPMGHHFLEAARKIISNYLSLRSEQDPSLDHAMAQDLVKDDGWMNFQLDTECVALEIEDIVFDELLDEILCS